MSFPTVVTSSPLDSETSGTNASVSITYPGTLNDIQTISTTGIPTGGTFTVLFGGQTSGTIAYNASAATLQTALNAMSSIGASGVTCYGGPLTTAPIVIVFTGTGLSSLLQPLITLGTNSLTGGTNPSVSLSHTLPGGSSVYSNCISMLAWSYNATPTGGNLLIQDGGDTIFNVDVTTSGAGILNFNPAKAATSGNALTITLAAGGANVIGKLSVTRFLRNMP